MQKDLYRTFLLTDINTACFTNMTAGAHVEMEQKDLEVLP